MDFKVGEEVLAVEIKSGHGDLSEVSLTPAEGDPDTLACELTPVGGHSYLFEVNGRRMRAHAVRGPAGWYVSLGGQQILVVPPEILEQDRRRGAQVDAEQHVTPPMPGQVIEILVASGDAVEAGQAVIVISAMKMETSLTAPHAGTVTAVNTEVGAQVAPGDILVDIGEA